MKTVESVQIKFIDGPYAGRMVLWPVQRPSIHPFPQFIYREVLVRADKAGELLNIDKPKGVYYEYKWYPISQTYNIAATRNPEE